MKKPAEISATTRRTLTLLSLGANILNERDPDVLALIAMAEQVLILVDRVHQLLKSASPDRASARLEAFARGLVNYLPGVVAFARETGATDAEIAAMSSSIEALATIFRDVGRTSSETPETPETPGMPSYQPRCPTRDGFINYGRVVSEVIDGRVVVHPHFKTVSTRDAHMIVVDLPSFDPETLSLHALQGGGYFLAGRMRPGSILREYGHTRFEPPLTQVEFEVELPSIVPPSFGGYGFPMPDATPPASSHRRAPAPIKVEYNGDLLTLRQDRTDVLGAVDLSASTPIPSAPAPAPEPTAAPLPPTHGALPGPAN